MNRETCVRRRQQAVPTNLTTEGSALPYLEIIHPPLSKSRRINRLITQRTRVPTTSHRARTRIHAILQTQIMNLVRSTAHAVGELGEVGHQPARDGVAALHFRPAVVEHDVLVPSVLEAEVDHGVGGLHDLRLVDVAEVGVLFDAVSTIFASKCCQDWDWRTHEFQPRAGSLPTPSGRTIASAAGRAARARRVDRVVIVRNVSTMEKSLHGLLVNPSSHESRYMLHGPREENRRACRQSPASNHRLHPAYYYRITLLCLGIVPSAFTPRKYRRNREYEVVRKTTGRLKSSYSSLLRNPAGEVLGCLGRCPCYTCY
jgi:hypothetical protein